MKYEVTVTIDKAVDLCLEALLNVEHKEKWIGASTITLLEGENNKEGAVYDLLFQSGEKESHMKETIYEVDVPRKITTIYEMGNVWNECINLFRGHDDHTHYKMLVTFKFPWYLRPILAFQKSKFIAQTEQGMNAFKEYVESL